MKFKIFKSEISKSEFLNLVVQHFPEIKDEDYEGLIHLQVGCLARHTNKQLKIKRLDELRRVIDFFKEVVGKVDSDTENALFVSFLENLELEQLKKSEIRLLLGQIYYDYWVKLRFR